MTRFIPREKLGKRARRQLNAEKRTQWAFSPATRRIDSKKLYNRKKTSHDRYHDSGMGFCLFILPRRIGSGQTSRPIEY